MNEPITDTEKMQRETVARLARTMWLMSDNKQVVGIETVCLIDLYRDEIAAAADIKLPTLLALGRCQVRWGCDGSLARRDNTAKQFAEKILATAWARAEMLKAWAKCAKAVEEANKANQYKCGRPGWASSQEVEKAMKEAGL